MARRGQLPEYAWAVLVVVVTTALCLALRPRLKIVDVAMVYLLGVVLVSARHRRGAAVLASVLSIAVFDFVFVPPYYTFDVHDSAYILTFGVMLAVALTMSSFTARLREQGEEARQREQRTAAMYALSRELAEAATPRDQIAIIQRHMSQVIPAEATVILLSSDHGDAADRWPSTGLFESRDVRVAASWAYDHGEPAGWGTAHCAEADALVLPLRTPTRALGVLVVRPEAVGGVLEEADFDTLVALAGQAGIALEPAILSHQHQQAREEVEAERLRSSLLSSLSHDLRTPLGSIEGAASSLLQESGTALSPELRQELAETILEESRRMTRLVGNLLDMVRVETGALAVQKAWQPLEETLGVALLRLEGRMGGRPIDTHLADDLPLVPIDELLIEQVFINLLENAAKYTEPETGISVSAWGENGAVVVEVADRGPGIPPGSEEVVFHKFYRVRGSDGAGNAGAGLGLTICRGIILAHGGRIWVQARDGGGAAFRFTLPLVGPPLGIMPPVQEA
jgi:two-component system, OmpR family, sensor histidine kinase KdpD